MMATSYKNDFEETTTLSSCNVNKLLIKLAIPIISSLLVGELYNIVDTLYVGRSIGAIAIGGLTIASPLQRFTVAIGLLISVGTSTRIGRSLGEGNYEKVKHIVTNALTLMLLCMLIITAFIYKFKTPLLYSIGATKNIFPYANDYISIVILGSVFQCFTLMIGYIITALGNAKVGLTASIIGAVSNIVLNYLFVIILSYGVKGAAISTVLSQVISAIFAFYHFLKIKVKFKISFKIHLNKEVIVPILAIGFSTFIVEIADAVVGIVLNNLLSSQGDIGIVIIGVTSKVSTFLYITVIGISFAMQPIVSYNYGAKNYRRVKEVLKKSIAAVLITSLIIWTIMMFFANPIISIFIREQDVLQEAVKSFRIIISFYPLIGVYFLVICYYQAIQDFKLSCLLSIFNQFIIFIPLAIILVRFSGLMGAWIAYPISDILTTPITVYYIYKAYKNLDIHKKKQEVIVNQSSTNSRILSVCKY